MIDKKITLDLDELGLLVSILSSERARNTEHAREADSLDKSASIFWDARSARVAALLAKVLK